jgi:hypothetical protein
MLRHLLVCAVRQIKELTTEPDEYDRWLNP